MMKSQDNELEKDPFLCTCGPCRRFWRDSYQDAYPSLRQPPLCRASGTSLLAGQKCNILNYGDRIVMKGRYPGVVRYVGFLDDQAIAPKVYVGLHLDDNVRSVHNGIYKGKRYFNCPRGHGAMVEVTEVRPVTMMQQRPPVSGNNMFPSYKDVCKRRKEREEQLKILYEEAQKPHIFQPPPKPPKISPRSNKAATMRSTSAQPVFTTKDPHDIVFKDDKDKEKKNLQILETMLISPEEQQMRKWRQSFGGKIEGERMATTLQKLHHAYQEGLVMTRQRQPSFELSDN